MKKKIIIILSVIVALALAAFIGIILYLKNLQNNEDEYMEDDPIVEQQLSQEELDKKKKLEKWKDIKPQFEDLGRWTINLRSSQEGRDNYASIELVVEYFSKSKLDVVIKNYNPIIQHRILLLLTNQNTETLLSPQGKDFILNEILNILTSEIPNPDDKFLINRVLFKNILVQ